MLTHRFFGLIILFFILWLIFQFTFTVSETPVAWFTSFFDWLHVFAQNNIPPGLLNSLIVSGIIDGVGGVLGFTPLIMFMFLGISLIEDSGYMSRIAFLLDRVLRVFGMHGNSIIAFIVSGGIAGGCAVPGVMATRTLRDPKERLATILTVPFMNCGAKIPVYALFIAAFFSENKAEMMFILTILSWFFALLIALILRKTILKGETSPFVMELPPYRLPTMKGLLIHMWERTWMYVKKAGTIILAISIIMWALMSFPLLENQNNSPSSKQEQLSHSIAGRIGKTLEPITKPLMGFTWQTDIALISGFAAKEVVIATIATTSSLGEKEDGSKLSDHIAKSPDWNPLKAFTFIIFVMLYIPCIAVIAVIKKETKSWKWTSFAVVYTTGVATIISTIIYQLGTLLGIGI